MFNFKGLIKCHIFILLRMTEITSSDLYKRLNFQIVLLWMPTVI